jgi:hypothetical protein
MKKLLIFLLILGFVIASKVPLKTEILKMNTEQKDSLYSSHNKNSLLAVYLNYIPSLGHAYTGNWIRGLSQFVVIFGGSHIITKKTRYNKNIDTMSYVFVYSMFGILLHFNDVYYLSEKHNSELYKYIYDEEYPKRFNTSIIQKIINAIDNKVKI